MTSEEVVVQTKENTDGIKALNHKVLVIREEAAVEKDKRHEVHESLLEADRESRALMDTMVDLQQDVKVAVFGCDKLQIDGLIKDNQRNKSFIKKLIWVWSGMTMAGAAFVAVVSFLIKAN